MHDRDLLQRYAEHHDEAAFTELVRRHLNLVYSVALRRVGGDVQFAQDVAQLVFRDLARKARLLADRPVLDGWLFTSTRYAAAKLVRYEKRRQALEEKVHAMSMSMIQNDDIERAQWEELRPVLDDVLGELKAADRDAVLLRFFGGHGYGAMGTRLQISEDAARMRVDRALEQVRVRLARRGVTSTAGALAAALGHHAVIAAPMGLVTSVSSTALAGATGSTWVSVLLAMNKVQIGIAGLLVAAGTTGFVLQARTNAALERELTEFQEQARDIAALQESNARINQRARETEALRGDDASFVSLTEETTKLSSRLEALAAKPGIDSGVVGTLDGAPVYDISTLPIKPKPVTQPKPQYPEALKASGVAGNVRLEFIIDATGKVRNVKMLQSSQAEFEKPAIEAVSQWKYVPAAREGAPVHTQVQMTMRFTTDPKESKHGSR